MALHLNLESAREISQTKDMSDKWAATPNFVHRNSRFAKNLLLVIQIQVYFYNLVYCRQN